MEICYDTHFTFCFREEREGIRNHRAYASYLLCVIQDVQLISYKSLV